MKTKALAMILVVSQVIGMLPSSLVGAQSLQNNTAQTDLVNTTVATIAEDTYVIHSALEDNKVLDITNAAAISMANLQLYDKNSTWPQKFTVSENEDGTYKILNVKSRKALDVAYALRREGANVWQYNDNGTDAQRWIIENTGHGYCTIKSKCNGMYLTVQGANTENGTNIQTNSRNCSAAQKFRFQPTTSVWNDEMIKTVSEFPEKGGYYKGLKPKPPFTKTTWQGLSDAFKMRHIDTFPDIDPNEATPSFCSSASYLALIKTLCDYDVKKHISKASWINLKPYTGVEDEINIDAYYQDDGYGCWGRGNANGTGIGVLVHELGAGHSLTAYKGAATDKNKETPGEIRMSEEEWGALDIWTKARPGDLMKIFWDNNYDENPSDSGAIIGCDEDPNTDDEAGHMVVFLGYDENGNVKYWSSNGPGSNPETMGYSYATTTKKSIQRVVFTKITDPEKFNNAQGIPRNDVQQWLDKLNGKGHGTTAELKLYCGIAD